MTQSHDTGPPPEKRLVAPHAAYDEIADWYEHEFLPRDFDATRDPIGVSHALRNLLGGGVGRCLEIGCGTGIHAEALRALGWEPVGIDVSAGMLRHAHGRMPAALADAVRLPLVDAAVPAVLAAMVHTDMSDYPAVLAEAHRVLEPDGVLVHIGVHPCFCGGFADRTDPDALVIRPGYLDSNWTTASYTDRGIRDKVGAEHRPLPWLLNAFTAAGFELETFVEGGVPTPTTLSVRARRR